MSSVIRYLSHPQVLVDPTKDIQRWSLSETGVVRVAALAKSNALVGTRKIISSAETKAIETATPLAEALGSDLVIREMMHENDRSATGFLPPAEFEAVTDQFFAQPTMSIRGWETAIDAQTRIVGEVQGCLRDHTDGDLLFVGHGAVGTLLFCYLNEYPINRIYDQGAGGGGCYFEFTAKTRKPLMQWQPMENLIQSSNRLSL